VLLPALNTRMEQGIAMVNKIPARVTKDGTLLLNFYNFTRNYFSLAIYFVKRSKNRRAGGCFEFLVLNFECLVNKFCY